MNTNEANVRLERFYDTAEQYRPTAHINRIYFHAGYTIEEVIANLRGIMALFAEEVGDVQDKLNDLLTRIELILQKIIDEKEPEIIEQLASGLLKELQESLDKAMALYNGQPALSSMLDGPESVVFNEEGDSANAVAHLLSPSLARNAVSQALWHDARDGSWYFTQSDNGIGGDGEGFVITHTDAEGNLVATMWVKGGGHGQAVTFVRKNETVYVIAHVNGQYKTIPYKDRTTVNATQVTEQWTSPANESGNLVYMSDKKGDIFTETATNVVRAYQVTWNDANNRPIFGEGASYDLTPNITPGKYVRQGITAIPEREITGVDTGNVLIVVAYNTDGFSEGKNENGVLVFLRYTPIKNTLEYVKEISRVDQGVKPVWSGDPSRWASDHQELEGVTRIEAKASSTGTTLGGLAWAINSGNGGQRTVSVMGFVSPTLQTSLNSARVVNQRRTRGNYASVTHLFSILHPGQYSFQGSELTGFSDMPQKWRGFDSETIWYMQVSLPDSWGNVTQTLYQGNEGSPRDMYQRTLTYLSANGWGDGYNPVSGQWVKITTTNQDAFEVTEKYLTSKGIKKLGEINETGDFYFSTTVGKMLDLEGIAEDLGDRGFLLTNSAFGTRSGAGGIKQKVIPNSQTIYREYHSRISGAHDPYGVGFNNNYQITRSPWFKVSGEVLQGEEGGSATNA